MKDGSDEKKLKKT